MMDCICDAFSMKFVTFSSEWQIQDEYQYYGSSLVLDRDRFGEMQRKKRKDLPSTKKHAASGKFSNFFVEHLRLDQGRISFKV